eukprot:Gregarina_sp_Poly_1__10494@NODE_76_length_15862_cov_98_864577_g65_i0_p4_GENE_NODE_76_length_15862_cov_98_864577_g65_i0NODE_76_length_15862_cov_98_864577_g65_i0_p4_ORF_typecomplete_len457_score17_82SARS_X4/PF08779_10/7_7e03SARS_X4/PF08779_10/2_2SARS_X4/PF08779_10/2_8e02_NODE_76_length_15862_cov_98_864577_g65_i030614431
MKSFIRCALLGAALADSDLEVEGVRGVFPLHHPHDVGFKHSPPVPFERGPLNCTCPDTYSLVGLRCERTIRFPVETMCPPGYEQTDSANCLRQVLPEERCPFGYARVKTDCIKRDVVMTQMSCPVGFELESTSIWHSKKDQLLCARRVRVPTALECPDGTTAAGQCVVPISVPARYICPAGFEPGPANTCRRVADIDCHHPKVPHHRIDLRKLEAIEGNSDQHYTGAFTDENTLVSIATPKHPHADKSHLRATFDTPENDRAEGVGSQNIHAMIGFHPWHGGHHPVHPPSPAISISQSCNANVTIPATPYCEIGELRDQLCITMSPTNPVEVCPAYGSIQDCYAFERENPRSDCPDGFTQECAVRGILGKNSIDCECVRSINVPVEVLCPPGAEYLAGYCQFMAPPYSGCPIGSRMVNGACEELQVKPCVCTYTVNFACQGPSCGSHPKLNSLLRP